ncbi:MAG: YicC/YloC family endoribonuclease [Desulfopila sp.]
MAVKSMTGFGRGEKAKGGRMWSAEVRCVNNRYLDIKIKLPRGYIALEERIRKKIAGAHQRGRVDLVCNVGGDFSDLEKVSVDVELARKYRDAFTDMAATLKVDDDISVSQLAAYPDVIIREQQTEDLEDVWQSVARAVDNALAGCEAMRVEEGASLLLDLQDRLALFVDNVAKIEVLVPNLLEKREKSLHERLDKLLDTVDMDPLRIHQEIAVLADKTDVTEELVRLRSHLGQFEGILQEEGAVGRKLDFLIQEFLREVNTLASKINDAETAHITVDLKSELEKIREQVQNLE